MAITTTGTLIWFHYHGPEEIIPPAGEKFIDVNIGFDAPEPIILVLTDKYRIVPISGGEEEIDKAHGFKEFPATTV